MSFHVDHDAYHLFHFYHFLALEHVARDMKKHIIFLEKFYRAFLNEICHDVPQCRELKKHAKQHGQQFVRNVLHEIRHQNPKIDLFMYQVEHLPTPWNLEMLKGFHVNTRLLQDLSDVDMKPQTLKNLVHLLWQEIKTGVELHNEQWRRHQSSRKLKPKQEKNQKKKTGSGRGRSRKKKQAVYGSLNLKEEKQSWWDTFNPTKWSPESQMLAAGTAALAIGGAAIMGTDYIPSLWGQSSRVAKEYIVKPVTKSYIRGAIENLYTGNGGGHAIITGNKPPGYGQKSNSDYHASDFSTIHDNFGIKPRK